MAIQLEISKALKTTALNHSKERMQFEYDRFGLDEEKRLSMILIGTLGQLVFKSFLDVNGIPHEFEFQAGKFDEIDFKIGGDIFEIKTSGYQGDYSKLNLLYTQDQFARGVKKDYKFCVQFFVNGYNRKERVLDLESCDTAVIGGYMLFKEIENYGQQKKFLGDDFRVPLRELRNAQNLLQMSQK